MARCSFHPNVETELTCGECGRAICPKEMVATPVGYKCPVCARPPRGTRVQLKPKQLAGALGFAAAAGVVGGVLLGAFGFGFFGLILGFMWGGLTAEAAHRGSGGHRGGAVTTIAIIAVLAGAAASWALALTFGFGGLRILTLIAAVVGAASDTAAWWARR
ncbi:MAG: hypothetical protein HY876_09440 [Coriobacteriales bacterium]|nr:hypothetical protein [Coriobacteriales bacterium]